MASPGQIGLKILIALSEGREATLLLRDLECLGHRVQLCKNLELSLQLLHKWHPDLVITEETVEQDRPDSGLWLAEHCRATADKENGWPGARALIVIPVFDWDRVKRAQRTGAHVIVKSSNFEVVSRYIQTISDNLATDRLLGPTLVGLHRFVGEAPHPNCENCEWIGASVSYGTSEIDLNLSPVRAALLNVLLFRRRGQSPNVIEETCRESLFLRRVLRGRTLRESAIKMEITRLRPDLESALQAIGTSYTGQHFLPGVQHGVKAYHLSGNRRIIHISETASGTHCL